MCGIVGIIGREPVAGHLVEALKRLEYRGYDSAGVATLDHGALGRRRAEGKLAALEKRLKGEPLAGNIGIGHTRWATHGKPNESNAHPHATDRVAVAHNGIIENFRELRERLGKNGSKFSSETDTEVVAHLVTEEMKKGKRPAEAVAAALKQLRGAFALAFLFAGEDDLMIGARKGSPLAIGYGDGEMYLGSDAIALAPFTDTISYLEDGDWAVMTHKGVEIHDEAGHKVERPVIKSTASAQLVDKGNHKHFMAKEIHEQPEVVGHTLAHYIDMTTEKVVLPGKLPFDWKKLKRLSLSACGTAFYAGPGGEILVRALRQAAGGDRYRLGIPLPRGAAGKRRSCHLHFAVGRDRRHAGDIALRQAAPAACFVRGQRADLDHRTRKRRGDADAGRA